MQIILFKFLHRILANIIGNFNSIKSKNQIYVRIVVFERVSFIQIPRESDQQNFTDIQIILEDPRFAPITKKG